MEDTIEDECCVRSEWGNTIIAANSFWIEGIAVLLIGLPGIVGNLLSVAVFTMRSMRNVFHSLLVILAIVDLLLIALAILDYSIVRGFDVHFNWYFYLFPHFIYPMTNMVLTASIFLVVAIAYERYVAVCKPYDYRATVNTQSTRSRVVKLLSPVFFVTVMINIPKYFETYTVEVEDEDEGMMLSYNVTSLRTDPTYITYYVNWFLLFTTGILPMSALIFLNSRIYAKILETRRLRERCRIRSSGANATSDAIPMKVMTPTSNGGGGSGKEIERKKAAESPGIESLKAENNDDKPASSNGNSAPKRHKAMSPKDLKMARVLLSIVLVFFICHTPRVVLSIIEFTMAAKVDRCGDSFCPPLLLMCAVPVSHFLLVLNSSINILIYCTLGEGFRAGLKQSIRKSTTHQMRDKDGNITANKTFGRLRNGPPSKDKNGQLLQVPLGGNDGSTMQRSVSMAGLEETMATCADNVTGNSRPSSRSNLREVDVEIVQNGGCKSSPVASLKITSIIVTNEDQTKVLEAVEDGSSEKASLLNGKKA